MRVSEFTAVVLFSLWEKCDFTIYFRVSVALVLCTHFFCYPANRID